MDKRTLKRLFADGLLVSATVEPLPMEGRWRLVVKKHRGTEEEVTLVRTGKTKIYQRYGAAVSDAMDIGFRKVELQML